MIVISKHMVLSKAEQAMVNAPLAGYNSVVTISNVTASSEDASGNFPVRNVASPATYAKWVAASGDAQTIQVIPGTQEVEFIGLARHNIGSAQSALKVDASSGSVDGDGNFIFDIPLVNEQMFSDDDPKMLRFQRGTYVAIQLSFAPTLDGNPVQLAVLFVGTLLAFQRKLGVGHTPLGFGDSTSFATSSSENGQFLGRLITSQTKATAVSLKNLTPDWYRDSFRPFQEAVKGATFFFAWRPNDYPKEVGYCWLGGDPKMTNSLANGMVSVDFNIGGIGDLSND